MATPLERAFAAKDAAEERLSDVAYQLRRCVEGDAAVAKADEHLRELEAAVAVMRGAVDEMKRPAIRAA
jgi:hypothetical protein